MAGALIQISRSAGGIPKLAVAEARLTVDGVEGDWQRDRKHHGGPNAAVCIYSVELYDWLRTQGIDLGAGQVGENFTTQGLDLCAMKVGDRLEVGRCVVEITRVRVPCHKLKQWDPRLPRVIEGHSGWKAKVVTEGVVRAGDPIRWLAWDAAAGRHAPGEEMPADDTQHEGTKGLP